MALLPKITTRRGVLVATAAALALTAASLAGANDGAAVGADAAQRCAGLAQLPVPQGKVLSAAVTRDGETFDSGLGMFPGLERLPFPGPLCRIELQLSAGEGSDTRAEVWLPLGTRWNGKLVEAGNGGFGGSLSDPMVTMRHAVLRGFAAAGNDMGHREADMGWLLRAAAVTDYEWRADRMTSLAARALVTAFYGQPARLKYYEGCSSGGRQAMMAAKRFPLDYDGIVAGAPAARYSDLLASGAWMQQQLLAPGARPGAADMQLVGSAAVARCDGADGLKDGLISDPASCRFDPGVLACKPGQSAGCLSPAKVLFFRRAYAGPRDKAGRQILPGMPAGGEAIPGGWYHWITMPNSRHAFFARRAIGGLLRHDPAWQIESFSLLRDLPLMRRGFAEMNADPADLNAFRQHGGRMIMFHGWADAGINPWFSVQIRDRIVANMGRARADETLALFMIPGLSHCAGGPGPDNFQMLEALDSWRDRGKVPDRIMGQWHEGSPLAALLDLPAGAVKAERPLCRYPKRARWNGKGDPARADSFACE